MEDKQFNSVAEVLEDNEKRRKSEVKQMGANDIDLSVAADELEWAIGQSLTYETIVFNIPRDVARDVGALAQIVRDKAKLGIIDLDGLKGIFLLIKKHDLNVNNMEDVFGSDFIRACRIASQQLSTIQ